jgi:hypothetical protein
VAIEFALCKSIKCASKIMSLINDGLLPSDSLIATEVAPTEQFQKSKNKKPAQLPERVPYR